MVQRHGELYAAEYEWNEDFEALVARIVAEFAAHADPRRERAWIAELDGVRAGSVFLVRHSDEVAQAAAAAGRALGAGTGSGSRRWCNPASGSPARPAIERLTLWTNSVLDAARRLYQQAGFRVVGTERHRSFGHDLTSETWELALERE